MVIAAHIHRRRDRLRPHRMVAACGARAGAVAVVDTGTEGVEAEVAAASDAGKVKRGMVHRIMPLFSPLESGQPGRCRRA